MVMTLEADYAVRIVEMLARDSQKIDAHNISLQTQVPLRFALKILRKLVAGGIVVSYKGAHGGYALAREPGKITLRQVIESVEGPYMLNRCQQEAYCCTHTSYCRFQKIYDEISLLVRERLDACTFESLQKAGNDAKPET
ncbi:MAG TPA: Rrf2 family transcriptional regulator [Clostridia bacterium]|nr:Rrf2 family transcriptional regulator [Clostridia bacterium]